MALRREEGGGAISITWSDRTKINRRYGICPGNSEPERTAAVADQTVRARLLAASSKESSLWIHAVPVLALGTHSAESRHATYCRCIASVV